MQRLAPMRSHRPPRRAAPAVLAGGPLLLLILGCAGCASTGEAEDPAAGLLRFGVLTAPRVGQELAGEAGWTPEDLLLEAVTGLSAEPDLKFVAVPGPLLGTARTEGDDPSDGEDLDEDAAERLVGALGSLAAPTYPALAPKDPSGLVAALKLLPTHPGQGAYWGRAVGRLRPVVLGPTGTLPAREAGEDDAGGSEPRQGELVLIHAAPEVAGLPGGVVALEVTSGDEVRLEHEAGHARLTLPSLTRPPHLYAIGELEGGVLRILLRSATGAPVPDAPAPITLATSP